MRMQHIALDDCWEWTSRDTDGNIMADPSRFPSGIPALVDYLHERNFSFGIYTSLGYETCVQRSIQVFIAVL